MTQREANLNTARVHLTEAARRRHHPANRDFYWTLLIWATNARRRAALATERDLFGVRV
jgi:hypothetical protein